MGVLLALASALAYGASDFFGGLLSRRASPWLIASTAQLTSFGVLAAVAVSFSSAASAGDLWWGACAGIGSGAGTFFLYRGLGAGQMNVVAPLSAVGAALVPVAVGVVAGERPGMLTWLGIACAIPAILLVSRASPAPAAAAPGRAGAGVRDGLLAGAGFGLLFVALGQVPEEAGLWPLALSQGVAAVILTAGAVRAGVSPVLTGGRLTAGLLFGQAALVGLLGAAATTLYQLAAQSQLVSVAAVLTSLYPALTVVLAAVLLHERVNRYQAVGLALAAAAVALVAAS